MGSSEIRTGAGKRQKANRSLYCIQRAAFFVRSVSNIEGGFITFEALFDAFEDNGANILRKSFSHLGKHIDKDSVRLV